jgi:glycosyltransferase involved in cell wall biosynthesis
MISIALCTYNGGQFLREQLESLRTQTLPPTEVQVGDDRSSDETLEIVEEFSRRAPFPVQVTVNSTRLGYGENFIQTARRCSGKWIGFCDQDDIWKPHKLERCAEQIGGDVTLITHSAEIVGTGQLPTFHGSQRNPPLSLSPRWFCLGFCQIFDSRILQFPRYKLPWAAVQDAHDVWVSFVAGMTGTIVSLGEPLAVHRRHEGNASNSLPELSGEHIDFIDAASTIASDLGLASAAEHYARLAERLRKREALKDSGSIRKLFELVASGAYKSGGYAHFGKRGLIRDVRTVIARR